MAKGETLAKADRVMYCKLDEGSLSSTTLCGCVDGARRLSECASTWCRYLMCSFQRWLTTNDEKFERCFVASSNT